MFTDTHCHIFNKYYADINEILKNAKKNDVTRFINNGTDLESNKEVLKLHEEFKEIYPALGFHPECIDNFSESQLAILTDNIDKIVAIGEIGLDYHYDDTKKDKQIALFEDQLKIAEKFNKPVIVHTRDALEDTISILKKYPKVKGVIHCFTGSLETAKIFIKMGYKLGFGGVSTFKNAKIKEVINALTLEDFILETDCPYLSPEPLRGTKNEPANIKYIAEFIAKQKNITLEELSFHTEKNILTIFDI